MPKKYNITPLESYLLSPTDENREAAIDDMLEDVIKAYRQVKPWNQQGETYPDDFQAALVKIVNKKYASLCYQVISENHLARLRSLLDRQDFGFVYLDNFTEAKPLVELVIRTCDLNLKRKLYKKNADMQRALKVFQKKQTKVINKFERWHEYHFCHEVKEDTQGLELEHKKIRAGIKIANTMRKQLDTFVKEGDTSDEAVEKYAQQATHLVLKSPEAKILAKHQGYRQIQVIAVAAFAVFGLIPGVLLGLGCAAVSKAKRNTWAFWGTESSVKAHEAADEMELYQCLV